VQPRSGGATGTTHSSDYYIRDHRLAAVNPAKYLAMTAVDLLFDGATEARRITGAARASTVSTAAYLQERRSLERRETCSYEE
jgi:hypothetical protein